ncbi:MAG: gamma-glutamylcyclotransferase family protein [Pseudomonadota bacterium]
MTAPFFFGYGSLVNRATHDYPQAQRARVRGWRRQWRKTKLRRLAFLTVTEAPDTEIAGLIAAVPGDDWAALDAREAAYLRLPVDVTADAGPQVAQIYRTRPEHDSDASDDHPILLSYLDTVLQGFLREFGEAGVADFMATTDGWDAPVLDDRDAPIYGRTQPLSGDELALVDDHLSALGSRFVKA